MLDSTQTRIVALRAYVSDFRDWRAGDGFYARHHWDVQLEYHPSGDNGENPVKEPNFLNSVDKVKEVYEMLRCLEVPLSTKDSELDSSQFAIQLEYEALRDVQGVLPISPGLLDEMEEHLCKDPTTPWTHCHHAPSFLYWSYQRQ